MSLVIIVVFILFEFSMINPLMSTLCALVCTLTGLYVVSLSGKDVRNGAKAR
jgi:hypothetical protein